MKELVFFLEEESARVLLEQIVPALVNSEDLIPRFIVFEGKQDLEKQLHRKLRSYMNPKARFIVLRDQDGSDCKKAKRSLKKLCSTAERPDAVVRIACRELEAFYLGDLAAVETGLGIPGLKRKQQRASYRDPDSVVKPSRELEKLTGNRYQKVSGSRAIASHLDLVAPRSKSFAQLISAIRRLGLDQSTGTGTTGLN